MFSCVTHYRASQCLGRCPIFFRQAEDGIRDLVRSRGLGDVYKRQPLLRSTLVPIDWGAVPHRPLVVDRPGEAHRGVGQRDQLVGVGMDEGLSRTIEPATLISPHPAFIGDWAVGFEAVAIFVVAQLHRGDKSRGVSGIHRPVLAWSVRVARLQQQNFSAVAPLDAPSIVDVADLASLDGCLLYTSDAADERSSVDLGGRRNIQKKTKKETKKKQEKTDQA